MFKFGSIILVPFPFTDLSSSKLRPALIISEKDLGDDVIVVFVTSKIDSQTKHSILLEKGSTEFTNSGLKVASQIRFDKVATLNKKIILGELGHLSKEFMKEQKSRFYSIFGF